MSETAKHRNFVPYSEQDGWHRITDTEDFVKWQYGDSPYRVVAFFREERGHWRTIFTTWYDGESYLIRGNNGGGGSGRMKAIVAAKQFMEENENGCPPPGEYDG